MFPYSGRRNYNANTKRNANYNANHSYNSNSNANRNDSHNNSYITDNMFNNTYTPRTTATTIDMGNHVIHNEKIAYCIDSWPFSNESDIVSQVLSKLIRYTELEDESFQKAIYNELCYYVHDKIDNTEFDDKNRSLCIELDDLAFKVIEAVSKFICSHSDKANSYFTEARKLLNSDGLLFGYIAKDMVNRLKALPKEFNLFDELANDYVYSYIENKDTNYRFEFDFIKFTSSDRYMMHPILSTNLEYYSQTVEYSNGIAVLPFNLVEVDIDAIDQFTFRTHIRELNDHVKKYHVTALPVKGEKESKDNYLKRDEYKRAMMKVNDIYLNTATQFLNGIYDNAGVQALNETLTNNNLIRSDVAIPRPLFYKSDSYPEIDTSISVIVKAMIEAVNGYINDPNCSKEYLRQLEYVYLNNGSHICYQLRNYRNAIANGNKGCLKELATAVKNDRNNRYNPQYNNSVMLVFSKLFREHVKQVFRKATEKQSNEIIKYSYNDKSKPEHLVIKLDANCDLYIKNGFDNADVHLTIPCGNDKFMVIKLVIKESCDFKNEVDENKKFYILSLELHFKTTHEVKQYDYISARYHSKTFVNTIQDTISAETDPKLIIWSIVKHFSIYHNEKYNDKKIEINTIIHNLALTARYTFDYFSTLAVSPEIEVDDYELDGYFIKIPNNKLLTAYDIVNVLVKKFNIPFEVIAEYAEFEMLKHNKDNDLQIVYFNANEKCLDIKEDTKKLIKGSISDFINRKFNIKDDSTLNNLFTILANSVIKMPASTQRQKAIFIYKLTVLTIHLLISKQRVKEYNRCFEQLLNTSTNNSDIADLIKYKSYSIEQKSKFTDIVYKVKDLHLCEGIKQLVVNNVKLSFTTSVKQGSNSALAIMYSTNTFQLKDLTVTDKNIKVRSINELTAVKNTDYFARRLSNILEHKGNTAINEEINNTVNDTLTTILESEEFTALSKACNASVIDENKVTVITKALTTLLNTYKITLNKVDKDEIKSRLLYVKGYAKQNTYYIQYLLYHYLIHGYIMQNLKTKLDTYINNKKIAIVEGKQEEYNQLFA